MEPELVKWLESRKLPKKVIKILDKEQLATVDVICHMKEDDLQSLKTQYSLSMGQLIQLRAARDAIIQGEFISAPANQTKVVPSIDSLHKPSSESIDEPADGHISGYVDGPTDKPTSYIDEPTNGVTSETEKTVIESMQQKVESDDSHDRYVVIDTVPELTEHHDKLQKRLVEAEKLNKKGQTHEASKQTQEVMEGAQVLLDGIKTDNLPENLSQNIGHIDDTVNAFRTGNQHKRPHSCCLLL